MIAGKLVDRPIGFLVAKDGLYILAGLREGDGFHKLVDARIGAGRLPIRHATIACVVSSESVLLGAAEAVERLAQLARSEANVHGRVEQLEGLEVGDALFASHFLTHRGK